MARLVPLKDHPHNADPSATLIWTDHVTADSIYRVRAGYVAVAGGTGAAHEGAYPTEIAAREALANDPWWPDVPDYEAA